jgi:succinate dehydrogenase / fumarate reductase, cytochrome b subunit
MRALSEGPAASSRAGRTAAVRHVVKKNWASGKPKKTSLAEPGNGRWAATGSVGRKAIVAVSGVLLWGWTGLHLIGISSAYAGGEVMERYAGWLRQGAGVPLWGLRLALGSAFVLHVWLVLGLWARARRARPIGYAGGGASSSLGSTGAARALRWGSVLLLAGIVLHVLHFSFGVGLPGFDHAHVYSNLLGAFRSSGLMTGLYVAFAALFGFHLGHGLFAAPVSLGAGWRERRRRMLAWALGLALGLAYSALPLAVWLGVLR